MIKSIYPRKKQILLFVFSLIFGVSALHAQMMVSSGTTFNVVSGTQVISTDAITLAGTIDNQGTIVLKGNLINNGTAGLGTGTIEMSGTAAQSVSGITASEIGTLFVNNINNVTLAQNLKVTNNLNLGTGHIILNTQNLTLNPIATVTGADVASMVIATGSGEMRKEFTAIGSFVYPVGDLNASAEYSPVTLNFTAGTFAAGSYAGVNLVDAVYPDPNITVDFLTRYWNLSQNNITGFNCQATFNYADTDITGTEANIYTVKINPSPVVTYDAATIATNTLSAPGLTGFSTFTGMRAAQTATLYAFLQGPFNAEAVNMNNGLTSLPLGLVSNKANFPNSQPYGIDPYNISPFNYTGTENITSLPVGTVDWVLVELRSSIDAASATASTIIARRAGLLMQNGAIVEPFNFGGSQRPLTFSNAAIVGLNKAFFVVRHRNHLAIMSADGATKNLTTGVYEWDFRYDQTKSIGSGIKEVRNFANAVVGYAMYGGNGQPNAVIDSDDISFHWNIQFPSTGYYSGDFTGNTVVDSDDISFIWNLNFPSSAGISDFSSKRFIYSLVP